MYLNNNCYNYLDAVHIHIATYTELVYTHCACSYIYVHAKLLIGVEMVLRHIRNGVELDPIDVNRNYDFNFQQTNFISRLQILPESYVYMNMCTYCRLTELYLYTAYWKHM